MANDLAWKRLEVEDNKKIVRKILGDRPVTPKGIDLLSQVMPIGKSVHLSRNANQPDKQDELIR